MRTRTDSAFTLMELMLSLSVGLMVSGMAVCFMQTSAPLLAKNISINYSHNSLRQSLAALQEGVQSSFYVPRLLDATGAPSASPAAGVCFDRLLGDPYIVTHPGGAGLSAGAATLSLTLSTDPLAAPPLPKAGDVLLIDDAPDALRPLVASTVALPAAGSVRTATITLAAPLGSAVGWDPAFPKYAKLVRREALIVVPNGAHGELRHYRSFESSLNALANYTVVCSQMGTKDLDLTPFSIRSAGPDKWLSVDLRVRTSGFENRMAKHEAIEFSNFVRVQTMMPSRLRPQKVTP